MVSVGEATSGCGTPHAHQKYRGFSVSDRRAMQLQVSLSSDDR